MRKADRLKEIDPLDLSDDELDIQVGALQDERQSVLAELAGIQNAITRLQTRLDFIDSRLSVGRTERTNRGNGQGRGRGQGRN